jgi:hypothetical protein
VILKLENTYGICVIPYHYNNFFRLNRMREAFCIYTQHCVLIGGGMIKAQQNQLYLLSFECSTAFAEKNATCSDPKNY